MNIALVHHQYKRKGGMESYLFEIASAFANQGDSIDVLVYKIDPKIPVSDACNIIKYNCSYYPFGLKKILFDKKVSYRLNKKPYDFVLSLSRTTSQDMVVCGGTHRGFLSHLRKKPGWLDWLEVYLEQKSFTRSQYIMAHSPSVKAEIENLYKIDPQKIHMLYPPINVQRFNQSLRKNRKSYMQQFGVDPTKTTLLFPSSGHRRKGLYELLTAFNQLPASEFELIIVGSPSAEASRFKNVRCLGYINNIEELYAAVDFTILPSHYEPYGLVIPESLQCGTPVIISCQVGAKDLVSKDDGVILDEITPQGIIAGIYQAGRQTFNISSEFAKQHDLGVAEHVAKIKNIIMASARKSQIISSR